MDIGPGWWRLPRPLLSCVPAPVPVSSRHCPPRSAACPCRPAAARRLQPPPSEEDHPAAACSPCRPKLHPCMRRPSSCSPLPSGCSARQLAASPAAARLTPDAAPELCPTGDVLRERRGGRGWGMRALLMEPNPGSQGAPAQVSGFATGSGFAIPRLTADQAKTQVLLCVGNSRVVIGTGDRAAYGRKENTLSSPTVTGWKMSSNNR